jgi:hypothetical protein
MEDVNRQCGWRRHKIFLSIANKRLGERRSESYKTELGNEIKKRKSEIPGKVKYLQ